MAFCNKLKLVLHGTVLGVKGLVVGDIGAHVILGSHKLGTTKLRQYPSS